MLVGRRDRRMCLVHYHERRASAELDELGLARQAVAVELLQPGHEEAVPDVVQFDAVWPEVPEQIDVAVADALPRGAEFLGRLFAQFFRVGEPDNNVVIKSLVPEEKGDDVHRRATSCPPPLACGASTRRRRGGQVRQ